jgi:V/A-type H+-transporting ATPase subunit D
VKNVAPTKTNLLKLRDELKFARLGYELLDQKRNILVMELLTLVDQTVAYEAKADAALAKAFSSLEDASLAMGKLKLSAVSSAVDMSADITIRYRRVMGVALPVVETGFAEHPPYYSPMNTSFWLDAAVNEFRDALKLMGRLAELKISVMRLADEVRKTMRKVNALEKIAIPELHDAVRYIQNRLEENDRDMFVLMKMVKNRLSRARQDEVEAEVHTE